MATSSGIKAGKAFVVIEALDKTGKVLNTIRNRIGKFGSEISQMGQTMALRMAAALVPAVLSSKSFADFDDIMKIIQARSSGTAKEMDALRKQALDLGEATAFTSRHIGELQAKLAQKGFKRADIINMTEPIMNLARAGGQGADLGMDAEQAATVVSGVMRAFQMESDKAARVADLFTATVNNSNFTLEELVVSMQYAAPAAHEFGQSLEDTLAIVAAMRDLNIDASISGTAFRNMLLYTSQALEREKFNEKLSAATGKMIEFTDQAGNMRPVIHILTAIAEATKNMGNVEKGDLIAGLFETRASIPATAVGKSTKTLAELLTIFKTMGNLAKETSDTMESGPGGAFRMLESKVERLAIAIGDALAPAWISLSKIIGENVSRVTAWVDANKGLIAGAVAVTTGFLGLGVGMVVVGQLLRLITPIFSVLSGLTFLLSAGFAMLLSPVGVAAAALIVFSLAAENAGQSIDELTGRDYESSFEKLRRAVTSTMSSVVTSIQEGTDYLRRQWSDTFEAIIESLKNGNVSGAMSLFMTQLELTFQQGIDKILTIWEDFQAALKVGSTSMLEFAFPTEEEIKRLKLDEEDPVIKFGRALRATNEGNIRNLTTDNPARIARRAAIEEQLLKLKQRQVQAVDTQVQDTEDYLDSYMGSANSPQIIFEQMLESIKQGAGALIGAGTKAGGIAPSSNDAALQGSREAIKDFQENKFNAFGKGITDLLNVAKNSDKHLANIDAKLEVEGV